MTYYHCFFYVNRCLTRHAERRKVVINSVEAPMFDRYKQA